MLITSLLHTMSASNRKANVPTDHLKLSVSPNRQVHVYFLPNGHRFISCGTKKSLISYQSLPSPLNQFLFSSFSPPTPRSPNRVTLTHLAPLPPPPSFFHCSSPPHHTLISWTERCFLEEGMWEDRWE